VLLEQLQETFVVRLVDASGGLLETTEDVFVAVDLLDRYGGARIDSELEIALGDFIAIPTGDNCVFALLVLVPEVDISLGFEFEVLGCRFRQVKFFQTVHALKVEGKDQGSIDELLKGVLLSSIETAILLGNEHEDISIIFLDG
jgi:hypothetical protein